MALSELEREAMRADTREAAVVLADDVRAMRVLFQKPDPTTGDVRRISTLLRRLLLDNHLQVVAGPRIGRARIEIPDDQSMLEGAKGDFVTVGLAPMWGWDHRLIHLYRTHFTGTGENFLNLVDPTGDAHPTRLVTLQGFLSDRVARLSGEFITRGDILKYVLYKAFGAHLTGNDVPVFDAIRRMRYAVVFRRDGDNGSIRLSLGNIDRVPEGHLLDLAHAHLFATGFYLVNAPDVVALEGIIDAEVTG